MKLQFKEQGFQIAAVKAVVNCFEGQLMETRRFSLERSKDLLQKAKLAKAENITQIELEVAESIGYRNRAISISEHDLLENIQQIQRENDIIESKEIERVKGQKAGLNLTIEMETGTGKTYTYIRTMYELNKKYAWSKFIIIVPSIAIREGVYKSFELTQDHFQELYGHKIKPFIYNSKNPQDIENFAADSRISVMIINTQAFNATGSDARRIYKELDQFASRKPIEIIAQTNPIIIIDEPQSVDGEKTLAGMQDFNPLFTLRYSATHKIEYNKVFRLDALDAYNKKLVKKIQVKGISLKGSTGTTGYLYLEQIVLSTTKPPLALIEYEKRSGTTVKRVRAKLAKGTNLFQLSGEMPQYLNFTIQEIDGYFNKIVVNGIELSAGEAIGDLDEKAFRRIQIRETIISHLTKEKQLFEKGVKVLSLFFIDSVDKYRTYNVNNEQELGEYAQMFEVEYKVIRNEFIDLFHQEYNDYLKDTDPSQVHKGYMPSNYAAYLERDDAGKIHNGYFAIDKKNKLVDPETKRAKKGEEANSDDVSAYDLIMKDKERLLSFDEPTRFLFSHSALKEGWDNPNVFQICALKHSEGDGSKIRRRQEVGRGMRLCVNENGIRLDYDTVGEQVHDINKLTVIASETYEAFAKGLQEEIAATLKARPQKVTVEFFTNKLITDALGNAFRIDAETAKKINKVLYKADIIDDDDKLTDIGIEAIANNTIPLPTTLEPFRNEVTKLLKSIYTGEGLALSNEREQLTNKINTNFHKAEFKELWNKINIKTIYEVQFDTEKLITDSRNKLNVELNIGDRAYEVKSGELQQATADEIQNVQMFKETEVKHSKLNATVFTNTAYDIVGEIVNKTNLTRRTVVAILKAISPQKFLLVRKNPEEFIAKCGKLINEVKASLIINNIVYHKTEERFDSATVFANSGNALRQSKILKKHIYDYLITDSIIESKFAKALENNTAVTVYAKLPKTFYITTPIANYSPDWAIVFDKEKVRHIYFVAETKGADSDMELRAIEKLKIHCAEIHFDEITQTEVKFAKINSYDKLLELIQLN